MNPLFNYQNEIQRKKEQRELRFLSNSGALTLLAFSAIAMLISSFVFYVPSLSERCFESTGFYLSFDLICSFIYLFLPFLVLYSIYKKRDANARISFEFPKKKKYVALYFFAGMAFCMIGSYISAFFIGFIETSTKTEFVYELFSTPSKTDIFGRIIYIIRLVVFPALVEEFAIRGVIMIPLRKYSDTFAIFMSSLMFALMHGNMVQLPFAFIAGFALAYVVIATDSIWPAIFIHMGNNSISVIQSFILEDYPEAELFILIPIFAFIVLGIASTIILFSKKELPIQLAKNRTSIPTKVAVKKYLTTPAMIIAIVYMLISTLLQSEKGMELMRKIAEII